MKVVELFAGIGGFRKGFQDAADESKRVISFPFVSEWDKFAQKSYEAIWGEVPHGDITKIDAKDIPDHDILVGGFPCQAFSTAGKMKGFEDTRGTLFFDMVRIAREKKPKAILMENVKGLVGHDKGNTLDVMVKTLNDIGYLVDFDVLNSKHYDVPQNRERIFIVAVREDLLNRQDWDVKGSNVVAKGKKRLQSYAHTKSFVFDFPSNSQVNKRLKDILELEVDESYYLSEEKTKTLLEELRKKQRRCEYRGGGASLCTRDNIAACLDANYAKGMGPSDIAANRARRSHVIVRTLKGENLEKIVKLRIRKLIPLECWRLQAFDDDMFYRAKNAGVSNSQLYKQAGNSVTTTVIKELALKLFDLLDNAESGELAPPPGQTNIFDFI